MALKTSVPTYLQHSQTVAYVRTQHTETGKREGYRYCLDGTVLRPKYAGPPKHNDVTKEDLKIALHIRSRPAEPEGYVHSQPIV